MATLCRLITASAVAFAAVHLAQGQTALPAQPPFAEEAVVLSPFTVQTSRDTGYQATNTLAGTRLNTAIRDVGAALSIYTKDFLTDVGATSSLDLLVYVTGAEVGGVNGNFAGTQQAGNTSESYRNSPQGATRLRGLAAANLTRGYFNSDIAFDDYNTTEVTVSRGPNAILFGLGSPSGIINQGILRADYRDRASAAFRIDNFGSTRSTLDIDRSLLPRKLALRIAGLYEDERFQQKPAFEQDRRTFATLTYEPSKSTTIRANLEHGRIHANRPSNVLAIDSVSPWLANGKYLYDFAALDRDATRNAGQAPNTPLTNQARGAPPGSTLAAMYDNAGVDTISRYLRTQVPAAQQATTPNSFLNVDGQQEQYTFYVSPNVANYLTGYRVQGFTPANAGVFDWKNRMFEGTTAYQKSAFRALNVTLEQRALRDHIGVELAFDHQKVRNINYLPFGNAAGSEVFVDVNTTLSDGTPNPNVGRPFIYTGAVNQGTTERTRQTAQATAFARYDFAELGRAWAAWLGSHTVTGLAQKQRIPEINYINKLVVDSSTGIVERIIGASERPQQRQLNRYVYVGPSLLGANSIADLQLSPVNVPIYTPGQSYTARIYDPNTLGLVNSTATSRAILNSGTLSLDTVESYAGVLQSKWLKDHIVTLVGWRQDKAIRYASSPPLQNLADANSPFTFTGWDLPGAPSQVVKGDARTYSVVANAPRPLLRHVGVVSDLSVFFNKSDNFQAGAGRIDFLGRTLTPPTGVTKEYGLNLSLAQGKFSVRWNMFETSAAGVSANGTLLNNMFNAFFANVVAAWDTNRINRPADFDPRASTARLFQGIEPQIGEMKQLFNYGVSVSPLGVATATFRNLNGLNDTTDFVAKGQEIDLIYNPTKNWRLLLNAAKQMTVQSNISPVTTAWLNLIRANYTALADVPQSGLVGPGQTLGQYLQGAVYVPYQQALAQTGTQAYDQRKYRANLVTNYTFATDGVLKGWNLGGALRWQDRAIVGYPIVTVAGVSQPDFAHKVTAPKMVNLDAFLGYRRQLTRSIEWRAQLNVKNLYAPDDYLPINIQPDGAKSNYRLPGNRIFSLTNTFSY